MWRAQDIITNSSLSDIDTQHFNISAAEKQESMEEVNTEISVYLGMLYFLVQVFKGDEEFGDELSAYHDSVESTHAHRKILFK